MMPTPDKFTPIRAAASRREHGTHARYVAGCHCLLCRAAHSRYNSAREKAKQDGDWNGVVSAEKARMHLLWLSKNGIGYKVIAAYADVAPSILFAVKRGTRKGIRARAERRILATGIASTSDGTRVDAAPTWALIEKLLCDGYSKAQLARWLGYKVPAIQMKRTQITARNAMRVQRMYRMVREGRLSR
jgi:hypothetical protein